MPKISRLRALVVFSLIAIAVVLGGWRLGRDAEAGARRLLLPTVSATMTAAPTTDVGANGPIVNPGDTLRYTATITNGAAPGAGNDASNVIFSDTLPSTLTLTAGSLHASPIAANDTYDTVGNTLLEVGVAASGAPAVNIPGGVLGNDITPPTAPDTFSILSSQTTSASGGTVTVNPNGTFSYLPAVGFTGADTFTYTLKNDAAPSLTSVGTVTVNVGIPKIWYVNSAAAAGGDGRSTTPFNSLTPVNGVGGAGDADGPGDTIYMFSGNYATGIILENNQQLIGNGIPLVVQINASPVTLRAVGTRPILTSAASGVLLASTNTLSGFNIGNTGTTDITGTNFGTLTANAIDITGSGRTLDLQTGAVAATFDTLTSTAGPGGPGLNLSSVTGTLTVTGSTSLTNAGTQGISISGSGLTAGFGATTVTTPTTQGILIGTTTGNITFGNTSVSGGTDGVSFQNNSAGTRTISGTLGISGGSGSAFLHGAGGGNVTVSGAATLASTANPVDVQGAGAAAINFAGGATVTKTTAGGAGVNLAASSVTFESLGITTSNGPGLSAVTSGTVTVTNGSKAISATGSAGQAAPAIIANAVTLNANFSSVTSTNSGNATSGRGISLTTVAGTSNFGTGSITGASDVSFFSSGGNGSVTYNGAITQTTAARAIDVQSKTGGTYAFGGAITANNGTGRGVFFNSNASSTFNFTGGIALSTGAQDAFTATSSGTVTATQNNTSIVNTLATTTGQSLKVTSTTIGAAGLTFRSISSNGGTTTNGVTLDTTGAGAFTVTGNGTAASGGVIQTKGGSDGNTTQGIGIYLNSVGGAVSLTRMDIQGCANYGIRGITVSGGLTLDNSTVGTTSKNGTLYTTDVDADTGAQGEGSLRFLNLTGGVVFSNDSFDNGFARTIFIHNNTAGSTLNLSMTNSTLRQGLNAGNGGDAGGNSTDALFIQANNSATTNLSMSNVQVTAYRQFGVLTDARDTATMDIDIGSCNFSNNNTGNANASTSINFSGSGGTGNDIFVRYNVHNNTFRHGSAAATPSNGGAHVVSGQVSGGGKFDGKVLNNTFGVTGVAFTGAGNGADALRLFATGNKSATTRVTGTNETRYLVQGNTIQRYGEVGLQINARQGNAVINASVLGNTIREPGAVAQGAFGAIWVNSGAVAADTNTVNIAIGGSSATDRNTLTGTDPSNATAVFLDSNTNAGALCFLNVYRNGSAAAVGATNEDTIRNILVSNNTVLASELDPFFTNANAARPMGTPNGLPPQPSIAPPPIGPENATLILDTPESIGGSAEIAVIADISPALGDMAALTVERTAASQAAHQSSGKGIFAALSEMISPTTYAQDRDGGAAVDEPQSGETITVNGGSPTGFTIPAGKVVTIVFDAQIAPVGTIPPATFAVSNQGSVQGSNFATVQTDGDTGTAGAQPTVTTVVQPETITKAFNPTSTSIGQQSTLTFTITNANPATAATAVTFTDVFPTTPSPMTVASPVTATNTCGGSVQNNTGGVLTPGDPGIKLVGGSLAANNASCTVTVKVTAPLVGTYNNTSGPISSFEGSVGLTSTAQLNVNALTAAGVSVSGRVLSTDGRGLRGAIVTLTDSSGTSRSIVTGPKGGYKFDDVEAGQTYTISVLSRRFHFIPRVITVTDELSGLDFTAEPYQ
jgi:uncharacterized repeat protein (TIGR01451 family)